MNLKKEIKNKIYKIFKKKKKKKLGFFFFFFFK